MKTVQYCTPEWLEVSAKGYRADPKYQQKFEKLSLSLCLCIKAEPAWGIDEDITFGVEVQH